METAAADSALIEAGEKAFKKCQACHQVGDGASNKTGPHLNGVFGRTIGGMDGFKYSNVFQAAAGEGRIWDEENMAAFLTRPKEYMQGTKMAFAGLQKDEDLAAITVYLESFGE